MDRMVMELLKKIAIGAASVAAATITAVGWKSYKKVTTKSGMEKLLAEKVNEDKKERVASSFQKFLLKTINERKHTVTLENLDTHKEVTLEGVEVSGGGIMEGQVYQIS